MFLLSRDTQMIVIFVIIFLDGGLYDMSTSLIK